MRHKEDGFEINNKNWRKIHKNFHSNNVIQAREEKGNCAGQTYRCTELGYVGHFPFTEMTVA